MRDTFDIIKEDNRLLFNYIRGSWAHGIAVEGKSDIDMGGVFIAKKDDLLGLGLTYKDQVANSTNDVVWYELKKFMSLLLKSNPTILEALYVDDKFIKHIHPIMAELRDNRDAFLTKRCFPSFFAYAKSQIEKARGLNKMINWDKDKVQRKGILDFTYTFFNQGSTKIENWLEHRNLNQKYCGLVNIPNMKDIYGLYYDWGNFFLHEGLTINDILKGYYSIGKFDSANAVIKLKEAEESGDKNKIELYSNIIKLSQLANMVEFIVDFYDLSSEEYYDYEFHDTTENDLKDWFNKQEPIGYKGMVGENSQALRLSSVSKGEKPICHISYNQDGYIKHCADYKHYKDWEKYRNPIRYESNLTKSYDGKNMCECFRLIHCGIEIASGNGYIVDRSGIDADFLLDIKNHRYEYDELMIKLEEDKAKMDKAMVALTLKDEIDPMFVNELYRKFMNEFYDI